MTKLIIATWIVIVTAVSVASAQDGKGTTVTRSKELTCVHIKGLSVCTKN